MTGIYKIQNKVNNKVYIGQAKNIESRWRAHIRMLESNTHHSKKLQQDFNEMGGISTLSFSVIELCSESVLVDKEKQYIQEYDSVKNGYNCVYSVDENGCLIYDKPNPSDTISISYDLFEKIKNQTTFSEMSIYLYFLYVADDNGEAIVSKRDLANYFGVGKLAIKNRIDKLIKMGLVNKDKNGSFNVYKVTDKINSNNNIANLLAADVKYMISNYSEPCEFCCHYVECEAGKCPNYNSSNCIDSEFGRCEVLCNTPCAECIECDKWEWRGYK